MAEHSRTYNSILNSIFGIAASFVTIVLNFAVRVVLVRVLGEEINGIHNLLQSILSVMALIELGIGTATTIHLYKPLGNNDWEAVRGIMSFYKKLYAMIALFFAVISLIIAFFFLEGMLTSSIDIGTVRGYFLIFSLAFVVNYLTITDRTILYAEQKNRVSVIVTAICELIFRSGQIVLVLVYHEYYLFLVMIILEKLVGNEICSHYVRKRHPYLKDLKGAEISQEKKSAIFKTVKPLMVSQLANTAQHSSGSIIISMLLGNVSIVGYFGNYNLLVVVVQTIFGQFGASFTTSFGSLAVSEDKERMRDVYLRSAFIINWMAALFCAGFLTCADDFIAVVFGEHFILDLISVIIIDLNLMVYLLVTPMISMQNAMGLHRFDASYMVLQAILVIIMEVILGKFFGMPGIMAGIFIPYFFFSVIRKGMIISDKVLEMKKGKFLSFIGKEILKIVLTCAIAYIICSLLPMSASVWSIIIKALITIIIAIVIPYVFSLRDSQLPEAIAIIQKMKMKFVNKVTHK